MLACAWLLNFEAVACSLICSAWDSRFDRVLAVERLHDADEVVLAFTGQFAEVSERFLSFIHQYSRL